MSSHTSRSVWPWSRPAVGRQARKARPRPLGGEPLEGRRMLAGWPVQALGGISGAGDVATLADGSAIVTGYFAGTATFGSTTLASSGFGDIFVAKLNPNGSFAWATRAGGSGEDDVSGVEVLADGSAIVTGQFSGTATFGGTTLIGNSGGTLFVAKLKQDGSFAWATRAGGSSDGAGVAVLTNGSAIVTGDFSGTATFGGTTLTSSGENDIFVAKLNANGSFAWATRAGGSGSDFGSGVAVLADGSAIVTGGFSGTATFGGTTCTSSGENDIFVAKLNPNGSFAWATRAGGSGRDSGGGVAVLADGSAIVTGGFSDTATFGGTTCTSSGKNDIFVAKLNPNGSFVWTKRAGGGSEDSAADIAVLADGSATVTGWFCDTATFGSTTLLGDPENARMFVAKVTPSGSFDLPPAAPSGVTGVPGDGRVTVSWQPPLDNGGPAITNYVIQYRPANQRVVHWSQAIFFSQATATTRTVTGLTNGMPYLFRVAAVNAGGTGAFSFVRVAAPVTPRPVPNAPVDVKGTAGNAKVVVTWKPPVDAASAAISGYEVQYSTDNQNWTTVTAPAAATSATVTGLANGFAYTFRVAAKNASGTGAFAAAGNLNLTPKGPPPFAPSGFTATPGSGKVTLSWAALATNGGSPLTFYRITYARKIGAGWGPKVTVKQAASHPTSRVVTGLVNGATYSFSIAAVTALGEGPKTPGVLATPAPA